MKYLFLPLLAFIFSCKKDKTVQPDPVQLTNPPTEIIAGKPSSLENLYDIADTTIYRWDLTGNDPEYYAIDINGDGNNDLTCRM